MRVIIAGGSGLIGRALSESLAGQGWRVQVLSRDPRRVSLSKEIEVIQWDGKTSAGWGKHVDQVDAIINLAGENIGDRLWSAEQKRRIRQSRIDAGNAVCMAVTESRKPPRLLIQASASGIYGSTGDEILVESSPPGEDFLAGVALDWEASTQAVEEMGVRRAVIRTGIVLAETGGVLPRLVLPFQLFLGGPLANGRQWLSWIHLADTIAAIEFLLGKDSARGIYNLCAPEPARNADFARVLGRVMKRPCWLPVPAFALKMVLGEMSTLVLDGQRVQPAHLLADGFRFRHSRLEDALSDLLK